MLRADAEWSLAEATQRIASAHNGGNWLGTGITSSAAASQANLATALGVLRGEDYIEENGDDFGGVTIDDDDIVMKYTWYGDADLDGEVNFDDYGRIDASINQSTGDEWFEGDFNYDNVVTFDDYALIDLGFNSQTGPLFFGGQTAWQQIAQMTHFSTPYMYFLIDEMEKHDIYLTEADFLPG